MCVFVKEYFYLSLFIEKYKFKSKKLRADSFRNIFIYFLRYKKIRDEKNMEKHL